MRKINIFFQLPFIFLLSYSSIVKAAHPLISEDPFVQGQGNHQFEFNSDQTRSPAPLQSWANLTYTYGLNDATDLFLNLTTHYNQPAGAGDHSLGLKYRFSADTSMNWGAKLELIWPTGSYQKGLGGDQKQLKISLVAAQELQNFSLLSNLGASLRRTVQVSDKGNYDLMLSQAAIYNYSPELKLLADLSLQLSEQKAASNWNKLAVIGLIYSPTKNCDLDLGVRWQQQNPGWQRSIGAGITLRM